MAKIDVSKLLRLANEFEDSAKTLRSGEIPPNVPEKTPEVEIGELGPISFDTYLDLTAENLKEAKDYVDKALKLVTSPDSFSPDVESHFYHAQLKLERARQAYKQAFDV